MATEEQYTFFRSMYDAEEHRYVQLQDKAKFFFAVISAYLGAITFKASDIVSFAAQFHVPSGILLSVAVGMLLALVFTVLAMRIRGYERVTDPVKLVQALGNTAPTNAQFWDDRIIDLAAAANYNFAVNGRTAKHLMIASLAVVVSIAFQLIAFTWAALR
jgi:hypothetical protein